MYRWRSFCTPGRTRPPLKVLPRFYHFCRASPRFSQMWCWSWKAGPSHSLLPWKGFHYSGIDRIELFKEWNTSFNKRILLRDWNICFLFPPFCNSQLQQHWCVPGWVGKYICYWWRGFFWVNPEVKWCEERTWWRRGGARGWGRQGALRPTSTASPPGGQLFILEKLLLGSLKISFIFATPVCNKRATMQNNSLPSACSRWQNAANLARPLLESLVWQLARLYLLNPQLFFFFRKADCKEILWRT